MSSFTERLRLLLAGFRSGRNRNAVFDTLWGMYYRRVKYYLRSSLGIGDADGDDLTQEIMLKIYDKLDTYDPTFSFNTWIYRIARNHAIDYIRRRKLETVPIEALEVSSGDSPESHVIQAETTDEISLAIESLKRQDREVIYFRFYERMKLGDIADLTDLPVGSVKSRLHYSKEKIKKFMEDPHDKR